MRVSQGTVAFQGNRGSSIQVRAGFTSGVTDSDRAADASFSHDREQRDSGIIGNIGDVIIPQGPSGFDTSSGAGQTGGGSGFTGDNLDIGIDYSPR
jgi:hypothetical protein